MPFHFNNMQDQLTQFINEIKSAKGLSTYDEAATKQIIILKVLSHLKWDIFDLKDIQPEYPVDPQNSNEKVDYALAKTLTTWFFLRQKELIRILLIIT